MTLSKVWKLPSSIPYVCVRRAGRNDPSPQAAKMEDGNPPQCLSDLFTIRRGFGRMFQNAPRFHNHRLPSLILRLGTILMQSNAEDTYRRCWALHCQAKTTSTLNNWRDLPNGDLQSLQAEFGSSCQVIALAMFQHLRLTGHPGLECIFCVRWLWRP